jgi:hypothetical protein
VQAYAARYRVAIAEEVPQGDEVHVVVRMLVADGERRHGRGVAVREERTERALSQVEDEGVRPKLDEV